MQHYKNICEDKIIKHVSIHKKNIEDIDIITISFKDSELSLNLIAVGDCCSSSWFYFFDDDIEENLIGKNIISIEFLNDIKLPPSNVQEYDTNHLVNLNFLDGSKYDFVLRNSSNGYYDGWIEIEFNDFIYPRK